MRIRQFTHTDKESLKMNSNLHEPYNHNQWYDNVKDKIDEENQTKLSKDEILIKMKII